MTESSRTAPAADIDLLRLENQLCFPLYATSRLVTRLYQPLLEPLGLTYPQYIVLMILWQDAPCPVSQISERALLNTNTLDHPRALATYRKAGFRPVRTEAKELQDPRVLWPDVYRWPPA